MSDLETDLIFVEPQTAFETATSAPGPVLVLNGASNAYR